MVRRVAASFVKISLGAYLFLFLLLLHYVLFSFVNIYIWLFSLSIDPSQYKVFFCGVYIDAASDYG